MARYLPIILGVFVIVGLTIPQISWSDRFAQSNVTATEFAELLKNVPTEIGDWHGEDLDVDEQVRKTAGAVGYVSRFYRNSRTGDEVKLWLIVGHSRDITGHTPDVCYPSSGFSRRVEKNSLHPFVFPNQPQADFWTNTFTKEDADGRSLVRVYWSWYSPQEDGTIRWEAPEHPRWTFGNARALYKMYFTSDMRDHKETTEQSACVRFAREFLPVVEEALTHVQKPGTSAGNVSEAAEPAADDPTRT